MSMTKYGTLDSQVDQKAEDRKDCEEQRKTAEVKLQKPKPEVKK